MFLFIIDEQFAWQNGYATFKWYLKYEAIEEKNETIQYILFTPEYICK